MAAEAVQETATTAARTIVDLAISPTSFTFHIETDSVIIGTSVVVGASLAAIYFGNNLGLATKIKDAITIVFVGEKDDRDVGNINRGSLLVDLRCRTAESFLQFLVDYKSRKVLQDLEEELLKEGIEVKKLTIKIKNKKEVKKHKKKLSFAGIEWRTIDGKVEIKKRESSHETTEIREREDSTNGKEGDDTGISVKEHEFQTTIPHSFPLSFQNLDLSESKSDESDENRTELHLAAIKGDEVATEEILKHSTVGVNVVDQYGNTALHYACQNGNPHVVLKLIEAEAEINITNKAEQTPLHLASGMGHSGIVEILITMFNVHVVNAVDIFGRTALDCCNTGGEQENISFLLTEAAKKGGPAR